MKPSVVLFTVYLGLLACGDSDHTLTWGDVSGQLASDYCAAAHRCASSIDAEICTEHVSWHLCDYNRTCDVEVDASAADVMLECQARLERYETGDASCITLTYFGRLPDECLAVFDFKPETE